MRFNAFQIPTRLLTYPKMELMYKKSLLLHSLFRSSVDFYVTRPPVSKSLGLLLNGYPLPNPPEIPASSCITVQTVVQHLQHMSPASRVSVVRNASPCNHPICMDRPDLGMARLRFPLLKL